MNIRYSITKIEGGILTLQNISIEKDNFTMNEAQVDEIFIFSRTVPPHIQVKVHQSKKV